MQSFLCESEGREYFFYSLRSLFLLQFTEHQHEGLVLSSRVTGDPEQSEPNMRALISEQLVNETPLLRRNFLSGASSCGAGRGRFHQG